VAPWLSDTGIDSASASASFDNRSDVSLRLAIRSAPLTASDIDFAVAHNGLSSPNDVSNRHSISICSQSVSLVGISLLRFGIALQEHIQHRFVLMITTTRDEMHPDEILSLPATLKPSGTPSVIEKVS